MTGPERVAKWASTRFQKELRVLLPELDPSKVFMAGVRAIRAKVLGTDPVQAAKELVNSAKSDVEKVASFVGKKLRF